MTKKTKIISSVACLIASATISMANEATAATDGVAALMANQAALADQKNWETKISLGYELNNGNSENESFSGAISTEKNVGVWRLDAKAEGAYKETTTKDAEGKKVDEQTEGNAKAKVDLKRLFGSFFVYAGEELSHDAIADVKYRSITSLGLGAFIWDAPEFRFPISIGLAYVTEEAPEKDDYLALRFTEETTWQANANLKLWQKFEFIPEVSDFDNILINGEIGGETKLTESLALTIKYVVEYDAEADKEDPTIETTDSKFITQITYSF
ncbi:MAG: DUF481 domain-containing protein [Kiritimatiellae bacterium]|nr:DUF481 domain-containing protein [Kiritimatiellia bacterium]